MGYHGIIVFIRQVKLAVSDLWICRHVDYDGLGIGHAQLSNLSQGVCLSVHLNSDLVQRC